MGNNKRWSHGFRQVGNFENFQDIDRYLYDDEREGIILSKIECQLNLYNLYIKFVNQKSEKCEARVNRSSFKFSSTRAVINWEADEIFCTRRGCDFQNIGHWQFFTILFFIELIPYWYFHNFWKFHGQRSNENWGRNNLQKYWYGFAPDIKYVFWNWIRFVKKMVSKYTWLYDFLNKTPSDRLCLEWYPTYSVAEFHFTY